jgi:cysteine-rich repeat protein
MLSMAKLGFRCACFCLIALIAACGSDDDDDGAAGTSGSDAAGTGSAAGTGASGMGASGTGASGTGASGMGASGTGASGMGASGMGASGMGASGTGASGTGASGAGAGGAGAGGEGGSGVDCSAVDNACDEASAACDGDMLVTCAENDDGCLVETETNCVAGANTHCNADADPPHCAGDPCLDSAGALKPGACVDVGSRCAGDVLIDCVADAAGCPIAERTDCTIENNVNACRMDGADAECYEDECGTASNCDVEGEIYCRGTRLVECVRRASDDCLVEEITNCASTAGRACDPNRDPPRCAACTDECDDQGTTCDGEIFETCDNTDEDACWELTREACSDACDDGAGCIFDDDCDGPAGAPSPFADTLREPGSYGAPFNTAGAGNNFASFGCASGAEDAPDLLFSLDIEAATRATVTIAGVMTFTSAPTLFLLTDCTDAGGQAEQSCEVDSPTAVSYFNESAETVRVYVVVDANGASNVGTFGLELDIETAECGDGVVDESETCDDGNEDGGDGCNAACQVTNGYACTQTEPSICTVRDPEDGICGNLRCALPANAMEEVALCCTVDDTCGLAYPPVYGENCIELAQAGVNDNGCDDEASSQAGYPTLNGCCRPDGWCGLTSSLGLGCVRRSVAWEAMQDGPGGLYSGPFNDEECN